MELKRRKFQGVLNIFIISQIIFEWPELILWIIVSVFIYGLIMPLVVSAYVYDFSGYYNFNWLKKHVTENSKSKQIININAGFDETSFILKNKFPNSHLKVYDFYNSNQHTEPAIIRARKVSLIYPNTKQITTNLIPLDNQSIDYIFLLSAVHEIRSFNEKVQFLKECHRICKPKGKIIMIEHLRDLPNFLAFSVGFTHFFSKKTWMKALKIAGFSSFEETKFTPFMSIFNCEP